MSFFPFASAHAPPSPAVAASPSAETSPALPEPIAATRLWCTTCRVPKPFFNKPMAAGSRFRRPGWQGEHLVCRGCSTTVATLYVEEAAADA